MLKVDINNLKIFGYHGCFDVEKIHGQFFNINISYLLSDKVENNDSLDSSIDSTIDYIKVVNYIKKVFNHKRYNLLEDLAIYISDNLLNEFQINSVEISIKKSNKYIMEKIDSVEVTYKKNNA